MATDTKARPPDKSPSDRFLLALFAQTAAKAHRPELAAKLLKQAGRGK